MVYSHNVLTLLKQTHLLGLLHININLGRRIGIVNTVGQTDFHKGVSRKINSGDKIDSCRAYMLVSLTIRSIKQSVFVVLNNLRVHLL
jgi:hypothetical protein